MLLVPALLLLALAAGCQDDDTSLPLFTRLLVSPTCGVAPMEVEGYAILSGGNETGDPMGANNNLAISWNFGDGGTGSSTIAYHTFNTETDTTYTVTVTGRDPDGNTATASVPVTVYTDSLVIQAGSDFPDGNVTTDQIIHFNIAAETCDIDFPTVLGDSVKMVFKWEMGDPGNYQVYETDTPGNSIAVTGAALQPDNLTVVVLTLASSASGISHTVQVDNVEDDSGNPILPGTTRVIFEAAGPSDIVINEVMQNPAVLADSDGEWFEVYNAGTGDVDMNGWTISDEGFDSHVIDNGGSLMIGAGEYKVFVRNAVAMAAEGVAVFYEYATITLGNSDDELILTDTSAQEIDKIAWDGGPIWPDPSGYSMQWTGAGDNNDGSTWVDLGAPAFGSGDRGTPGSVNDWVSPVPSAGLKTVLDPNYPNPFNPRTSFSFSLDKSERVTLAVFDVRGSRVRTIVDSVLPAGRYDQHFSWDGMSDRGIPANSGTYFFRLTTASGFSQTGKMTLLK